MATESNGPAANAGADWHLREAHELAREHEVDPGVGLHDHQVAQRARPAWGHELPEAPRHSILSLAIEQFSDFMILVLIGAAVISGLIGDVVDTVRSW